MPETDKWWYETAWNWCTNFGILPENITYKTGNFRVFLNYQQWHKVNHPNSPMWNLEVIMQMLWCYAPKIFNQGREQFDFNYCEKNSRSIDDLAPYFSCWMISYIFLFVVFPRRGSSVQGQDRRL